MTANLEVFNSFARHSLSKMNKQNLNISLVQKTRSNPTLKWFHTQVKWTSPITFHLEYLTYRKAVIILGLITEIFFNSNKLIIFGRSI